MISAPRFRGVIIWNKLTMANHEFDLTLFRNSTGVLTKKLQMRHGKIESEAPKMSTGIANRVRLTLEQLPDFIAQLENNQCFAPGVMDTEHNFVEVLAAKQFEKRGMKYPVHADETGVYGTRSANSMTQKGNSLILFDYDHDPHSKQGIDCPEKFLDLLDKAAPELRIKETSYVRTYSTSTSLYEKGTDKQIRPANGFHIYMVVDDGEDIKRFGKTLAKRCWLAGMGHIKISSNGNRLLRTIFDTNVHQPERLCFESGAFIEEDQPFYQKLPKGEVNLKALPTLNTKRLKELTPEKEREYNHVVDLERNSDHVNKRVEEVKDVKVQFIVNTTHYSDEPLTRRDARKIVDAHENFILHPMDILEFEDGRKVTVLDAYLRADEFDKVQLLDPLRPEKGYSKCKFYANRRSSGYSNPTINSFVEGGRSFQLQDSMTLFLSSTVETESKLEEFDEKALVFNQRYFPKIKLKEGLTLIKGEKGTGKTSTIQEEVRNFPGRVLGPCHLVSLTQGNAKRFDLFDYSQIEQDQAHLLRMKPRLAICLNSMYKLQGQNYDLVVLDEVCQFVRNIIASTVDKPAACLKVLREILANAKYIVCLDADLNKQMVDLMRSPAFGIIPQDMNVNVIINEYKPAQAQGRKITLYQDMDGKPDHNAYNEMLMEQAREDGLFYATNSKGDAVKKAALILKVLDGDHEIEQDHFMSELPDGRRVITITSNNSQNAEVQEFMSDLNGNLRSSDIFISSPSMGTGHSIDAVEGVSKFAKTFGYFTKMAGNLPSDCLQHLSRVRECREFHVVVVDNAKQYPMNKVEILHREVFGQKNTIDNFLCVTHLQEYDYATKSVKINDHGWAEWYGEIKVFQNTRLNSFSLFLKSALDSEGYDCTFSYQRASSEGRSLTKMLDLLSNGLSAIEKQKLRVTPLITDEEYQLLDAKIAIESDERRKMFKKRTSDVFGALKNDRELNDIVTMSTQALNARRKALLLGANNDHLFMMDMINRFNTKKPDQEKTAMFVHQQLMRDFLSFLGIEFLNDVPSYDGRELENRFKLQAYDYLGEHRRDLQVLHGITFVYSQEMEEISKFIARVLASIGLKYERQRVRGQSGLQSRHYLDSERVSRLRDDILRAQQKSKTVMFTQDVEIPMTVKAYYFQYAAGTPAISELHPYVGMLKPEIWERFHRLLGILLNYRNMDAA